MIGIIILAIVLVFLAVLILRALAFKPKAQAAVNPQPLEYDKDAAVSALQQLVRCRTISYNDPSLEDESQFQALIDLLPRLYPHVFEACEYSQLPDRALLFRWPGKVAGEPAVLMSHYDVVPVQEDMWDKPPFEGIIEEGVLWGRGTLDTKATMNAALRSHPSSMNVVESVSLRKG